MAGRLLATLGACLLVAACQIAPPATPSLAERCNIPKFVLSTEQPENGIAPLANPLERSLNAVLAGAPAHAAGIVGGRPKEALLLSGGSERGAYGAGYLRGWGERRGGLPDFDLVTGVSAGSILSTAAFIGDYEGPAREFSNVTDERQVLDRYVRLNSDGDPTLSSFIAVAQKGGFASLQPMGQWLKRYLTSNLNGGERPIDAAAAKARRSSKPSLFVAATDTDSGKFVVFDLGEYLRRETEDGSPVPDHVVDCYVKAVIASSIVPLAAVPEFIDGRLYVDGGARYGVFALSLIKGLADVAMQRRPMPASSPPIAPHVYILVNGSQDVDPDCKSYKKAGLTPTADVLAPQYKAFCRDSVGNINYAPPQRPKWSLPSVGLRAVDILINQIYRFSTAVVRLEYLNAYGDTQGLHFTRIKDDLGPHPFGNSTCEQIEQDDFRRYRPLEFYPNFMRCLVDYGRQKGGQEGW